MYYVCMQPKRKVKYKPTWDLRSIPDEVWRSEQARRSVMKRWDSRKVVVVDDLEHEATPGQIESLRRIYEGVRTKQDEPRDEKYSAYLGLIGR